MPAQSLHLAGAIRDHKIKAAALRRAKGGNESSCLKEEVSQVGLQDQNQPGQKGKKHSMQSSGRGDSAQGMVSGRHCWCPAGRLRISLQMLNGPSREVP